jgi:hypothetical protein
MGIRTSVKTKAFASLKLYNAINSFIFEQSEEELKGNTKAQTALVKAASELAKIIKTYKQ